MHLRWCVLLAENCSITAVGYHGLPMHEKSLCLGKGFITWTCLVILSCYSLRVLLVIGVNHPTLYPKGRNGTGLDSMYGMHGINILAGRWRCNNSEIGHESQALSKSDSWRFP